jgi:hypothetical protein
MLRHDLQIFRMARLTTMKIADGDTQNRRSRVGGAGLKEWTQRSTERNLTIQRVQSDKVERVIRRDMERDLTRRRERYDEPERVRS